MLGMLIYIDQSMRYDISETYPTLILIKEITPVHTKPINTKCRDTDLPTFLKKESEAYKITACQSVCPSVRLSVCPPLITFEPIGMKFSREFMQLKVTSTPYFLIPYLQPLQNGGRSNFWGGCKTCTSQRGTMKFCILIDLQRLNNF
jgi:hypothetical protein